MLSKVLMILSFSALASFKIIKEKDNVYLSDSKIKLKVDYNSKLIKESKSEGFKIVDYYMGEYGTKKIVKVYYRAMIINDKIIINAPYKYEGSKEQPYWKHNKKNKMFTVIDPLGINIKRTYK